MKAICTCDPVEAQKQGYGSDYVISRQVLMLPPWETGREAAGLSPEIAVDGCMKDVIQHLWYNGVTTLNCCCGHTMQRPSVCVSVASVQKMLELGYEQDSIFGDLFYV